LSGVLVDRAFLRFDAGLVHYRSAGVDRPGRGPLVMAHGGPGSSAGLAPMMAELAADRLVVAPDMMGNGDSDPPPIPEPEIAFYADCLLAVMDRLGLERVALYGHHTGAQVVSALAVSHPDRVSGLVLDGVALFPDALRAEFLDRYAPAFTPDEGGAHLLEAWRFVARTTQAFPHYSDAPQDQIPGGAPPPPAVLATRTAEVLKVWSTYHLAYLAAFRDDMAARLPRLQRPVLVLEVEGDPLSGYAEKAAALAPRATVAKVTRAGRAAAVARFLNVLDGAF
jgi:pimeloyl-ACP methyl ester carboxylesterase